MPAMTYYVSLPFKRSEDDEEIVACDPKLSNGSQY
jgi:hypothetical protein